jgi:hypothetical protein
MKRIGLALLALVLIAPGAARAGVVIGLGSGVTKTGGSMVDGDEMKDAAAWMIPFQLEAGWKFADRLTVVGFFNMNVGKVSGRFEESCDSSESDCLANMSRAGVQARWNFLPSRRLDPWVGAGYAWEVLAMESTTASGSGSTTNLQGGALDLVAGVDYWLLQRLSVSPYLGLSVGSYRDVKELDAIDSSWKAIPDSERTTHTQVTAGVRLAWAFGGGPRAGPAPVTSP